jgi:tetratricopeptide (TPR) repeat protein
MPASMRSASPARFVRTLLRLSISERAALHESVGVREVMETNAMRPIFPAGAVCPAFRPAAPFLVFLVPAFLAAAPAAHGAEIRTKAAVAAFGLYGDQNVFESEATRAAKIVAERFPGGAVAVRANTKRRADAHADTVASTLKQVSEGLEPDTDVLFVILTSHGSQSGLDVKAGKHEDTLSPLALVKALDETQARYRVVIVSACYSGVFARPLADPNTLVITAADADHSSFGCRSGNEWTYFGDAFFNTALRHTSDLHQAFAEAGALIRKRERAKHLAPSSPQIAGGENVQHVLKGEFEKVVAYSRDGAGLDAKYAFSRGVAAGIRGDYEYAIDAYGDAIRQDPKYPISYNNRGVAYFKTGDNDRAIADYTESIKRDPKIASIYANRGRAWRAKGDHARALADYGKAISLDGRYADAYNNRGLTWAAKGDHTRAIADYTKAIRIDPKLANAYENRGHAYDAKGEGDRASRDFEEAIRLDPKLAGTLKTGVAKP